MRVALIMEQCLAPVPGGTGRYAVEVAGALASRPGVAVTGWVAWHRRTGGSRVAGVAGPRRLPLPRRPLVAAWERGVGPVPGGGVDLVHAPTPMFPPRRRRPLVVTVHDAVPWTHPETLTPRGVRWHRAVVERAARTADAVVVPTRAVEEELRRHLSLRTVHVIGEGVSSGAVVLPSDAVDRARRLGLPDSGFLLSLATVEPRKGLDVLLAALTDPGAPDLPLLVAGQPGWGGIDPVALAEGLGLRAGRVRVLGRVADEDLAVLLSRATALVVPSRAEGFGLPVLEGMAAGAPVVTSADPALLEVGGDAVRAAPTGDAAALAALLADVVSDARLREQMVSAGRLRAASFTWEAAAERLEQVYAGLLARG